MILHHLHLLHLAGIYVVARYAIFAAHEVHAFNIKLVDAFALICYAAVFSNLHSGHT